MPKTTKTGTLPETDTSIAIRFCGVRKDYTLYKSVGEQALDALGFSRIRFWQRPERPIFSALDGIDLDIGRGERVGVIGRNGAGKTTLLKLITGNFGPTTGDVSVTGTVQALMTTGVGFHSDFTGAENIRAALTYNGLPRAELETAFQEISDFCELGDFLHQPVKTYSLGMRTRLQFATATAIRPDILIVDEVLGAGDAYFSAKSLLRMQKLTQSGCTLLLVSHAMNQVLAFCDRVVWLDKGRIRKDGAARSVVGEYEVFMRTMSKARLGSAAADEAIALAGGNAFRLAKAAGFGADEGGAFETRLGDGKLVFRWPGEPGIKLESIDIVCGGEVVGEFREHSTIEFLAQLRCDSACNIACRYQITIFTLDNKRITRIRSEADCFRGEIGMVRKVSMKLAPCLLGAGQYYISFAILMVDERDVGAPQGRYDLVARFLDFEIFNTLDYRENALFHHEAQWEFREPTIQNTFQSPSSAVPAT
jgi:lipopolysaccharide transport system ATP-binding protein